MKLLLTDFYHQPTQRLLESLNAARISYKHVNITYDGFLPDKVLNPFAQAIGAEGLPQKALHYNEIKVPEFYEIRNENGSRAQILNGDHVVGYVYYAMDTARLVREVQWLDRAGKLVIVHRYNRQGFKYADGLFNHEGKEVKTVYYHADGRRVLTVDVAGKSVISEQIGQMQVFPNLTAFVVAYLRGLALEADETLFNSMSTPFFVSNQLTEIPGSLYFQEVIGTEIPGNMLSILSGKTPTSRILFENAKEQAKVDQMATEKQVTLDYLGAIENFKREISFRPKLLTITRSDQILYDEAISQLTDYQWTIAAPSEVSEKLRNFANQHDNVHVLEAIPLSDIDKLLDEHDIYLDLNKGNDVDNVVRRAYLEGLLVIGDKSVVKNPGYELILENEKEITDVLKRPDKEVALRVLREKRGKPATVADYQRLLR